MKPAIFLSYGHDINYIFAEELANRLTRDGYDVFFDMKKLKDGHPWSEYIESGIEKLIRNGKNSRFILIMTNYSIRHPNGFCLNELSRAVDCHIPIIPIMLEPVVQPIVIYRLQYIDMTLSNNKTQITESFEPEYSRICRAINDISMLEENGNYLKLEKELSPVEFGEDIKFHQPHFTGREYYISAASNWLLREPDNKILCILGNAGVGKTALAINLYNKLNGVVAFYRFKRNYSSQCKIKRAITTIAYQLSTQIPAYRDLILKMNIPNMLSEYGNIELFDVLICNPLNKLTPFDDYKLIIIDGLDEAEWENNINMAVYTLNRILPIVPSWLKIIVTSRPENNIIPYFKTTITILQHNDETTNDVSEYINIRLNKFTNRKEYTHIKDSIIKNADGIFLYVTKICDEIVSGEREITDIVKYPRGLSFYYEDYFNSRCQDEEFYSTYVYPILALLIASDEPLSETTIKSAITIDSRSLNKTLNLISGVIIRTPNKCILSCHISFIEWLEDQESNFTFYVDRRDGLKMLQDLSKQNLDNCKTISLNSISNLTKISQFLNAECANCFQNFITEQIRIKFELRDREALYEIKNWFSSVDAIFRAEYIRAMEDRCFIFYELEILTEVYIYLVTCITKLEIHNSNTIDNSDILLEKSLLDMASKGFTSIIEQASRGFFSGKAFDGCMIPYAFKILLNVNLPSPALERNLRLIIKNIGSTIQFFRSGASREDGYCDIIADEVLESFIRLKRSNKIISEDCTTYIDQLLIGNKFVKEVESMMDKNRSSLK